VSNVLSTAATDTGDIIHTDLKANYTTNQLIVLILPNGVNTNSLQILSIDMKHINYIVHGLLFATFTDS